jgi:aconitate hydratase 2/2-methylisocitrate dehydratase
MKNEYLKHVEERKAEGLPPLALNAKQTKEVVDLLITGDDDSFYLDLLTHRVPPGVDEAAYVKASFLSSVATGQQKCPAIDKKTSYFSSRYNAWWIQH